MDGWMDGWTEGWMKGGNGNTKPIYLNYVVGSSSRWPSRWWLSSSRIMLGWVGKGLGQDALPVLSCFVFVVLHRGGLVQGGTVADGRRAASQKNQ